MSTKLSTTLTLSDHLRSQAIAFTAMLRDETNSEQEKERCKIALRLLKE